MKKVLTYGTFDLFHQGHYNIIKRAKDLGDYLIVGVTADNYDIERGKLSVNDSIATRIENVKQTGLADKIIVEEYLGQKIQDIIKFDVDTIVLGSDWKGKIDYLNKYCEVVYLERTKNISSTMIREEAMKHVRVALACDNVQVANNRFTDLKYVSGFHCEGVFCQEEKVAKEIAQQNVLNYGTDNFDLLLEKTDLVCIDLPIKERYKFIKQSLKQGKHVISSTPFSLCVDETKELFEIALKNHVMLVHNIPLLNLKAFDQLEWMVHSGMIGAIINLKITVNTKELNDVFCDRDSCSLAILTIFRLLGMNYTQISIDSLRDEKNNLRMKVIRIHYTNTIATIEIVSDMDIESNLFIYATNGSLMAKNDWWNLKYFEIKQASTTEINKYCYNFEGPGFKFILSKVAAAIKTDRLDDKAVTIEECEKLIDVMRLLED